MIHQPSDADFVLVAVRDGLPGSVERLNARKKIRQALHDTSGEYDLNIADLVLPADRTHDALGVDK